jgi:tRNA modification GTPase
MQEGLHKIVPVEDTIAAISTPLGQAGLGVIRMSGPEVRRITNGFFRPLAESREFQHQRAVVGTCVDASGDLLDEVVVTYFQAPHSYTGEDVIEITGHGNPLVLKRLLKRACTSGARVARPGEFTLRAVSHGKMDLLQAEAVLEFIEAQTETQARTALRQMGGSLSNRIRPVKERLVGEIAHLEAGIDFAEDDVSVPDNASVVASILPLRDELSSLRDSFGYGRMVSNGLRVAILGKPNVGKSSLFNRLLCSDRAIVTEIPGTTRDVLTETISIGGIPLRLADTAGIRQTVDRIESLGVTRTFETLSEADLALIVLDGSNNLDNDDREILQKTAAVPHMIVINKSDLPPKMDIRALNGARRVSISAKTGTGLDNLQEEIRAFLLSHKTEGSEDWMLTSERQYDAISKAVTALATACEGLDSQVPHEMILMDLYRALEALGELTGEVVTEDILDRIFSTFCIGK